MQSISRNLAVLTLVASLGCQSVARPAPWQTRRVPTWRPTPIAPTSPQTVTPPLASPWSRPSPSMSDKRVPNPTPDPQAKSGAELSDEITVRTNKPAAPQTTEQPQSRLHFKPVPPKHSTAPSETTPSAEGSPPTLSKPLPDDDKVTHARRKLSGPSLGFEALTAPNDGPLNLDVRGQRQGHIGGSVTFDVVVRNNGTETMTGVLVNVEFDEALAFPGRAEKRLKKDLGQLLPGQSREMRLTLASNRLGKHGCRFSVSAESVEAIEHEATVEFIDPKLQVRLIGPARRTVGSRAEFTVKVANTSEQPIDDLQVTLHHDAALTPHTATGGWQREEHALRWSLGRLEAGAGVQVQAEFDCRQLSEQACVTAEARSEELRAEAVENCVTVVAVPGLLDLRVSDISDPVKVGDEAEFEITVQNLGLQPVSDVQLDVQTSEHLRASTHVAKLVDREVTLTQTDRDGVLRLVLPDSLPADATLKITLRMKALKPGDAELRVVATAGSDGSSVETSELTSINP